MKKVLFVFLFMVIVCTGYANATMINFDDLTANQPVPGNYQGFNWDNNFYVCDNVSYSGYGNSYGAPSGGNAIYNGFGVLSVSLGNNADFDFNGAFFTGWASYDSYAWHTSTTVTVYGYNNYTLVGSVLMNLSANKYDWMQANLYGVDRLDFVSDGSSRWWLMDNFTYNENPQVPEPASMVLLGSLATGLFGFAGLRKRFTK